MKFKSTPLLLLSVVCLLMSAQTLPVMAEEQTEPSAGPGIMQGYSGPMGPAMMQGYSGPIGPGMMQGYTGPMGPAMMQGYTGNAAQSNVAATAPIDIDASDAPMNEKIIISVVPHAKIGPDQRRHDAFIPSDYVVPVGKEVTLVIVNYDEMAHTLTAPDLGMNISIPAAQPLSKAKDARLKPSVTTYTFTPKNKGVFRWYCATPCDGAAGGWAMAPDFNGLGRNGYMAGYFFVV